VNRLIAGPEQVGNFTSALLGKVQSALTGLAWIAAFGGYAAVYGRLLLRLQAAKRI